MRIHGTIYDAGNAEAAAIILSDPAKYPIGSALHVWASVIARKQRERSEHSEQDAPILIETSSASSVQDDSEDTRPSPQRPRCALEPAGRRELAFSQRRRT